MIFSFVENNKDSQPGEIDLHGLYVKEAITYTDRSIQEARSRGDSEIHFIVGMSSVSVCGTFVKYWPLVFNHFRQRPPFKGRCGETETRHRRVDGKVGFASYALSRTNILTLISPRHQLIAELDPENSGVLIVSLDGRDKGTGRVMRPDDITRGIESKDDGCVIM